MTKAMSMTLAQTSERIASQCICCRSDKLRKSPAILMPFIAKRVFDWEPIEITDDWGLRDIKSGMAYPLCNSLQCNNCGALFLDIRFTDSEMAALYSGYRGEKYTALRERFEPGYAMRNVTILEGATHIPSVEEFLSSYVTPPLKILDWGGDTGHNTPFRTNCEILHVYDISDKPVVGGATRADTHTVERTGYDLIVLSHVLEHIPYPSKLLSEITCIMKPETVLYIEVPYEDLMRLNKGAFDLHISKKYWHEHINFFTYESLVALLKTCGLQTLGARSIEAEGGAKKWHVFSITCKLRHPFRGP